jgi:polyisoprenoid-binding protein YceI
MELHPGSFEIGPDNARLLVRTHREGLGARAGHDLVIEATRWAGQVRIDAGEPLRGHVEVRVDTRGLEVREGHGGARPLTDRDRLEIKTNIEEKVLHADRDPELRFTAEKVVVEDHHAHLTGDLTIGGQTRPTGVDVDLEPAADGLHARGVVQIRQTDYGIKPYSAMIGMLKVADQVEVDFDVRLPPGAIPT